MSSIEPQFDSPGAIKIFDLTKPQSRDTQMDDLDSNKRLLFPQEIIQRSPGTSKYEDSPKNISSFQHIDVLKDGIAS